MHCCLEWYLFVAVFFVVFSNTNKTIARSHVTIHTKTKLNSYNEIKIKWYEQQKKKYYRTSNKKVKKMAHTKERNIQLYYRRQKQKACACNFICVCLTTRYIVGSVDKVTSVSAADRSAREGERMTESWCWWMHLSKLSNANTQLSFPLCLFHGKNTSYTRDIYDIFTIRVGFYRYNKIYNCLLLFIYVFCLCVSVCMSITSVCVWLAAYSQICLCFTVCMCGVCVCVCVC